MNCLVSTNLNLQFDESEEIVFQSIMNELDSTVKDSGRPIHMSARKQNSIRKYCSQARAIMRHLNIIDESNSDLIAFRLCCTTICSYHKFVAMS